MPKRPAHEGVFLLLMRHPERMAPAVRSIETFAVRSKEGGLALTYRLRGEISGLRVPPTAATERVNGLWKHLCFEAFVTVPGEKSYLEFNFSPSGQWAAYAFSDYRQRAPMADPFRTPKITVRQCADELVLEALISGDDLPRSVGKYVEENVVTDVQNDVEKTTGAALLCLGLSAVVETSKEECSYWALRHPRHPLGSPTPSPDFHHRDTFILNLPAPKYSL